MQIDPNVGLTSYLPVLRIKNHRDGYCSRSENRSYENCKVSFTTRRLITSSDTFKSGNRASEFSVDMYFDDRFCGTMSPDRMSGEKRGYIVDTFHS